MILLRIELVNEVSATMDTIGRSRSWIAMHAARYWKAKEVALQCIAIEMEFNLRCLRPWARLARMPLMGSNARG